MIADDLWPQNVLRSSGNKALRSFALNCLREIIWKPKICHRIVPCNTTNLILWFNARLFVCRNVSLRTTWQGLNTMLVTRTSWSKLHGMNAFITATASILKTGRKQPIVGNNWRESVVNSVGKFRNIRTGFGRYLNSNDWNEKISSPATRVPLQSPPRSFYTFSTAHVYLTFPWTKICGCGRLSDRLRMCGNARFCDRPRLLAIGDRLLSYGNQAERNFLSFVSSN